jgi:hypothetical protein
MSSDRIYDEGVTAKNCVLELFVDKQIGSGAYRRVYALTQDETCVVKVEYYGKEFCNVAEMRVWQEVELTPLAKWFAPCIEIDSLGIALIQKKTLPFRSEEEFHAALIDTKAGPLPAFFDDVHFGNFGMLDGRVVCHDYGFNHFIRDGIRAAAGEQHEFSF